MNQIAEKRPALKWLQRHAITLGLLAILLGLQYPLWLGKQGWVEVWSLREKLRMQLAQQEQQEQRNRVLAAELADLKSSLEGIEERARFDHRLIRPDEKFYSWAAAPATKTNGSTAE